MIRPRSTLAIVLMAMVTLGAFAGVAAAQATDQPSSGECRSIGTNDLQTTTWSAFDWASLWAGRFGSPSVYGWGRSSNRSMSGRATAVVLRERRGLLR